MTTIKVELRQSITISGRDMTIPDAVARALAHYSPDLNRVTITAWRIPDGQADEPG